MVDADIAPNRRDETEAPGPEGVRIKLKVCLVGANTGCKTRLVRKHVQDEFDDRYILTLGTKVSKKELNISDPPSNRSIHLDILIWDILGHLELGELFTESFFHGTKGIVAVSDMTRKSTVADLKRWIEDVQSVAGPIPVVVIGANHDQKDRLEVSEEDMRRSAETLKAPCFFASESSGEEVETALRNLADAIVRLILPPGSDVGRGGAAGIGTVQ